MWNGCPTVETQAECFEEMYAKAVWHLMTITENVLMWQNIVGVEAYSMKVIIGKS